MRDLIPLGLVAAAALLPSTSFAQTSVLRSGLQGRIVPVEGVETKYDAQGAISAGYYRIVVEDAGSSNAAICPKTKFESVEKEDRKRWKSTESEIFDRIFDKNASWTLVGTFATASPEPEPVTTTLRFASIDRAEDLGCTVTVGSDNAGITYQSYLIPINRNLYHFGDATNLTIKINYSDRADRGRISAGWKGLTLGVSALIPGAGSLLEAAAPTAEKEIDRLLDRSNAGQWTVTLDHNPGAGRRASAYYLDLGFFHSPLASGISGNSGVKIKIDYVGSVFAAGRFFAPIVRPAVGIIGTQVKVPSGTMSIPDLMGAAAYAALTGAPSVAEFNANCANSIEGLVKKGLSETDATIFVRAIGSQNSNVRDALHTVSCLSERNPLLKPVGLEVQPPPAPPPPSSPALTRATLTEVHDGLTFLGAILQSGASSPTFERAFAENVTLFLDQPAQDVLELRQITWSGPRAELLARLARKFSGIGCFAPRSSRPDLALSPRPGIQPVKPEDFVAAALLNVRNPRDNGRQVLIASMIFNGHAAGAQPQVSFISITSPTAQNDGVLKELTEGRRPQSCSEAWMDQAFER